jgi:peroxiredoxin
VVALVCVAALGAVFIGRFLIALARATRSERSGACRAMDPQLLSVKAPGFELPDLAGEKRRLADFAGKVVLLNFWATWCPPCVEELPSMIQLQESMGGRDFVLLTVSVDDSVKVVRDFLSRHRRVIGAMKVLIDPSRKIPRSYGTEKFPESYLIDQDGVVRYRFINKRNWASPVAQSCIRSVLRR